jgi:Sigma-70, region 4
MLTCSLAAIEPRLSAAARGRPAALRDPVLRPEDPLWLPGAAERAFDLRGRLGADPDAPAGASLSQIARQFNISRERVRQILQRDGW